ncbi:MAG TPA: TfuA-like protein [Thermoanaerobaculia bacterium]|nr:TfuA-like protein [Thermoanaerobaculia bacterium]
MHRPPIVYVGPSLPRPEAAAVLPGADMRGPIRRGDLYRDREAGSAVFVILDGVFFQQDAVSPREIVDVLADGALVVGAASMGALRAAECWPAGMQGMGTIYRLFRRGSLTSDDEVAVVFSPEEHEILSVPLVNVRHAAARAIRQGWLDRGGAEGLVRAAEETFYMERRWPDLLARAGLPAGLEPRLAAFDLKKTDARRALRRVAGWLAADPGLAVRPRRQEVPFQPSDRTRERDADVLGGLEPETARRGLARWHLLSGRGARHLLAVAAASPGLRLDERLRRKTEIAAALGLGRKPAGADGAMALRMAMFEIWVELVLEGGGFAEALWVELALSGDLDAEVLRWQAVRKAAERARLQGLTVRERDRYLAEAEIANAHGFPSWPDLRQAVRRTACPWADFAACRDELALAKRLREELFNPSPPPGPPRLAGS